MTDEFEKQYLGVDGVVHSEKVTFRGAFFALGAVAVGMLGFSAIWFVAAANGQLDAVVGAVFSVLVAGVLGLASVVGSVLRTIVTATEVVCHAGVSHEVRIPLAGVTQVTLTKYDAAARARAVKEGRKGFVAIHPSKPIVCVEWVDAGGRDHVAYLASEAPESLAGIIRQGGVRAKAQALGTRVRVDDEVAAAMAEVEDELERDVHAQGPAARELDRELSGAGVH
jgi:hypothetical protein